MNVEVLAGATCTLGGNVWDTSATPMLPKTSGTIYAVVQLNLPGHADHGKYWDDDDDTWQAAPVAWPTATYRKGSFWSVAVPAALTESRASGYLVLADLTDDVATPADSTVMSGGFQQASIVDEVRLTIASLYDPNTIADQVWDEVLSGHLDLGTAGAALDSAGDLAPPTAATIADAVWDEAIAGHSTAGSTGAALDAVDTPAGLRQVTIAIVDGASAPVPDVNVAVYDSGNTTLITRADSDADGLVVISLDDATYKVRLMKAAYTFTTPQTLVVNGDESVEYTATAWVPTPASAPDLCVVFGTLLDASGEALGGALVTVVADTPEAVSGNQLTSGAVTATTDEDGYFEIELVRGAEVVVQIPSAGISATEKTVPSAASQNFATW